jgi:hypothetical protein
MPSQSYILDDSIRVIAPLRDKIRVWVLLIFKPEDVVGDDRAVKAFES